jgi:hypothetical protein
MLCLYILLCWYLSPEIGISSIDWDQLSNLLPEERETIQSPKRCFKYTTVVHKVPRSSMQRERERESEKGGGGKREFPTTPCHLAEVEQTNINNTGEL